MMKTTFRVAIAGTAAAAAMAGFAGVASASPGPATAPTTTMSITNNTAYTLSLNGSSTPDGSWIKAPRSSLGPHETEVVTARSDNTNPDFTVSAGYQMAPHTTVLFVATNDVAAAKTSGTGVIGNGDGTYTVNSVVNHGGPEMLATYTLAKA